VNLPGLVTGGLLAAALSLPFSMRRRSRDTSAGAKTAPPRPAFLWFPNSHRWKRA